MRKNRSHSKIDRLPEVLRKEVENRLLEGHTYEEIADTLKLWEKTYIIQL